MRKMKALGRVATPTPSLPYEVSCPDLGCHGWEPIDASSGADAALRWARKHTIRHELERYGMGLVPVYVRAERLDEVYRLSYEGEPVYIAELSQGGA
jgi:hypothetical protein